MNVLQHQNLTNEKVPINTKKWKKNEFKGPENNLEKQNNCFKLYKGQT